MKLMRKNDHYYFSKKIKESWKPFFCLIDMKEWKFRKKADVSFESSLIYGVEIEENNNGRDSI